MSVLAPVLLALSLLSQAPQGVLAAPVAEGSVQVAASMAPQAAGEAQDPASSYAAREQAAGDLEQYRGGSTGLAILIVVIVAVVVLVAIIIPW